MRDVHRLRTMPTALERITVAASATLMYTGPMHSIARRLLRRARAAIWHSAQKQHGRMTTNAGEQVAPPYGRPQCSIVENSRICWAQPLWARLQRRAWWIRD